MCDSSLSGSECAVESFLSTVTQIMCCILQANLNGRFLLNPLPMTSVLPGQTANATDRTRDTAREGDTGRERRGQLLSCPALAYFCSHGNIPCDSTCPLHPTPCLSCPIHDLQHSMSSLKQQGERVRLGDSAQRQEHERDYARRGEATVTVSWIGVRGFVMVAGLGR